VAAAGERVDRQRRDREQRCLRQQQGLRSGHESVERRQQEKDGVEMVGQDVRVPADRADGAFETAVVPERLVEDAEVIGALEVSVTEEGEHGVADAGDGHDEPEPCMRRWQERERCRWPRRGGRASIASNRLARRGQEGP
jgi:hypothetical protein